MTLMTGAKVRLVAKYDPAALAKAIAERGVTIVNGVPATYQRLLEYKRIAGLPRLNRGSLRLIAVAGAPLDPDLKRRGGQGVRVPPLQRQRLTQRAPGNFGGCIAHPRGHQAVRPPVGG